MLSLQLAGLRKKELLRELFTALPAAGLPDLSKLAAVLGPQVGLSAATALAYLVEFTNEQSAS